MAISELANMTWNNWTFEPLTEAILVIFSHTGPAIKRYFQKNHEIV